MNSSRLEEFDALRGIAAASVFINHALLLPPERTTNAFLWLLGDGAAAVGLFFVLSGFVLARSLILRKSSYSEFVVRRCFRIYPAYWFCIGVSGLLILLHSPIGLSELADWPAHIWDRPVPPDQMLRYIVLIGPGLDTSFLSPIWSLQVEMRISLIFPLLFLAMTCASRWTGLLLLAASTVLGLIDITTVRAIPLFLLGIAIATNEVRFRRLQIPGHLALGLLLLGVALYGHRAILGIRWSVPSDYVSALGSGMIILAVMASEHFAATLRIRPLELMGRTSYSFFLMHLPIMLFVVSYLHRSVGILASVLVSFIVTLLTAYLMFIFIEKPGMRLGNEATRRLRASW